MNDDKEFSDETLINWGVGLVFVVLIGGAITSGAVVAPVRDWLVRYQILVTGDQVVIEFFGTGAGLDLARIILIAGVLLILVVAGIWLWRSVRAKAELEKR